MSHTFTPQPTDPRYTHVVRHGDKVVVTVSTIRGLREQLESVVLSEYEARQLFKQLKGCLADALIAELAKDKQT